MKNPRKVGGITQKKLQGGEKEKKKYKQQLNPTIQCNM